MVQDHTFSKIKKDAAEPENINKMENLDVVPRPDWEKYCSKVAERIIGEQSPERLYEVRGMLYELLVHCLPPNVVLSVWFPQHLTGLHHADMVCQTVTKRLVDRVDETLKPEVIKWAAFYEHRLKLGNKPIYHLEGVSTALHAILHELTYPPAAYVAKVMYIQVGRQDVSARILLINVFLHSQKAFIEGYMD